MTLVLIAVALVAVISYAHVALRQILVRGGESRAAGVASQLASLLGPPMLVRLADLQRQVDDDAVRTLIATPSEAAEATAFARLQSITGNAVVHQTLEIWTAEGRRVMARRVPETGSTVPLSEAAPTSPGVMPYRLVEAAGVGQEINNPLSAVVANLEIATAEIAALASQVGRDRIGELADEIRDAYEAAQRVRGIAMDLKVFSSGQAEANQPIDVERILESAVRMGWNQVRQRARLVKNYGGVPPAVGVEARLGQVFLNLIVNAAQAIPEGAAERNEIRLSTRLNGDGRIVIDIEDTGAGIPPHVMSQLFTPFVTTKPVGIGTGLGLSICQRLVTAMGGSIWADSTVGRGTVFHVALQPGRVGTAAAAPAVVAESAAARRARILIVDDEEMLGTLLRRVLRGHDVTVLTDARKGLELIDGGARFDAILCDLMMPVMTGIEFHRLLSERHPDLVRALIFLTGGAFTRETAAFLDSVPNPRVEKPFDAAKLRARVEAHLAERATRPPGEAA